MTTVPLTLPAVGNAIAAWLEQGPRRAWWLSAVAIVVLERIATFAYFIPTMVRLMGGSSMERDIEVCLSSENGARDQLVKDWATYSGTDRERCIRTAVYLPSYVEWLTCLEIDPELFGCDREAVRLALEAADIEARPVWKPMHLQPVFEGCEVIGGAVAAGLFARGLCLPSGSALTTEEHGRVCEVVRDLHAKVAA